MVISNPLIRSYAWVVAWWWVLGIVILIVCFPALTFSIEGLKLYFSYTFYTSVLMIASMLISACCLFAYTVLRHRQTRHSLQGTSLRGLHSTIGAVPLPRQSLPMARDIPNWLVSRTQHGKTVLDYAQSLQTQHPHHAAMLFALLRVYAQWPTLPACAVKGEQAGVTLIDHCCRVCALALSLARAAHNETLSQHQRDASRDAQYRLDPSDPMIAMIALAHDIGKISAFLLDAQGQVLGCKPNHDAIGAQLLALMDETFALPARDRYALLRSVAHHHQPSQYPVDKSGRVDDDRTVAFMMLLIDADQAAKTQEFRAQI